MSKWISVDDELPSSSGDYEVKYLKSNHSVDIGRFNRGFLGLQYLTYWSDEKYGQRVVTHWKPKDWQNGR